MGPLLIFPPAPFLSWAVCVFVLRLRGVVRRSLLFCPPVWGVFAGSVGAFLGFCTLSLLHDAGAFGPAIDALFYGLVATVPGALAGCIGAPVLRRRTRLSRALFAGGRRRA